MDERTENNIILAKRRSRRFPYTLLILPLFLLALGTLLYTTNNRNMFPAGQNPFTQQNFVSPVASPASGEIQVGVGGGGPITPTPSMSPTPTVRPTFYAPAY